MRCYWERVCSEREREDEIALLQARLTGKRPNKTWIKTANAINERAIKVYGITPAQLKQLAELKRKGDEWRAEQAAKEAVPQPPTLQPDAISCDPYGNVAHVIHNPDHCLCRARPYTLRSNSANCP